MAKIVPASRLVTDASLELPSEPPSIDRSRAIMPVDEAVADCASITATAVIPETRTDAAIVPSINYSLRMGWVGVPDAILPAHATHQPGTSRFPDPVLRAIPE